MPAWNPRPLANRQATGDAAYEVERGVRYEGQQSERVMEKQGIRTEGEGVRIITCGGFEPTARGEFVHLQGVQFADRHNGTYYQTVDAVDTQEGAGRNLLLVPVELPDGSFLLPPLVLPTEAPVFAPDARHDAEEAVPVDSGWEDPQGGEVQQQQQTNPETGESTTQTSVSDGQQQQDVFDPDTGYLVGTYQI